MGLYETIDNYLERKKNGIIATVIVRAGSTPRDVGAKMFVGEDGKLYGTIGGGRMEHDTYQRAMSIMGKGITEVLHIRMNEREIASNGMICGGDVDVLLEPVFERYKDIYKRLEYMENSGKKGILITRFDKGSLVKTLVEDDMTMIGDVLSEHDREIYSAYFHESRPHTGEGFVVEPLQTFSVLYVFGAGHVSQYIAKIAAMVDFSVVIIDDREEFANRERFPEVDEIIVDDFHKVFDKLKFTGKEFVVIVTRGHQYDANVLSDTLKRQTKYVGMIGSKRKVKMVFDHMKEIGFSDELIEKVHAPIGLAIHAETPQEIAVSIIAELISIRRG